MTKMNKRVYLDLSIFDFCLIAMLSVLVFTVKKKMCCMDLDNFIVHSSLSGSMFKEDLTPKTMKSSDLNL